jgi:hypothetical protein
VLLVAGTSACKDGDDVLLRIARIARIVRADIIVEIAAKTAVKRLSVLDTVLKLGFCELCGAENCYRQQKAQASHWCSVLATRRPGSDSCGLLQDHHGRNMQDEEGNKNLHPSMVANKITASTTPGTGNIE